MKSIRALRFMEFNVLKTFVSILLRKSLTCFICNERKTYRKAIKKKLEKTGIYSGNLEKHSIITPGNSPRL
jgi:hypothetical protein